ncbi:MAG: uroporphyrinogen decarboxylase family protein [Nitrospirota bacterium]
MTSYEKLLSVINGVLPEERPVAPEVFGLTARINGYNVFQYVSDGSVIAESQLKAREAIGYDILFAFADLSVEAEALGCTLHYEEDAYPFIEKHVLRDMYDIKELKFPDPSKDGRMPVLLKACRWLREAAGNECLIAACVLGPLTIASQLMGLERFLYQLADGPERVEQLLDFTEEVAIR